MESINPRVDVVNKAPDAPALSDNWFLLLLTLMNFVFPHILGVWLCRSCVVLLCPVLRGSTILIRLQAGLLPSMADAESHNLLSSL